MAFGPQMNGNGNAHPIAPLDASRLKIQLAKTLKPIPAPGTYQFGDIHTDHMLIMAYHPLSGWSAPEIKPYGPIPIDPASNCLQYASNVFEGMKAILDPQGKPRLFRPKDNMERLRQSAARMALPTFDPDALLTCISKLVAIESRLYIRPTMMGTKPSIKVGASDHAILYTIVTPVGPYFTPTSASASAPPTTGGAVSLLAVSDHVRSWPGGTGGFKLGLNYSPGFVPQKAAAALGYDQVLWLLNTGDGRKLITEAGAMNFFAVVKRGDGGMTIVTPPLDGTILPGITRDSTLQLLRAYAQGSLALPPLPSPPPAPVVIEERELALGELTEHAAAGTLLECFGTGTAVLVVGIERIGEVVVDAKLSTEAEDVAAVAESKENAANGGKTKGNGTFDITMTSGRGLGPMGRALWDKLLAIKEGREDFAGWAVLCE
ncbi:Branched-chain-amino-acid aminotransferase [Mycena sanguinolenta]|uniref:Branched-chain-amino-acid aminotransferase n=1 Tax=Mycena sanguinolenta TaxID=230812 RepID=A0A8H6Z2A4_9AGAR|nr:Branched-chain-amino-acid aminotransferase [Mycena sanguinolenta]